MDYSGQLRRWQMKKLFSGIIFLILFWPFICVAGEESLANENGHDWRTWSQSRQVAYVAGFMVGALAATANSVSQIPSCSSQTQEDRKALIERIIATNIASDITTSQIVDGLNRLYGDFKNQNIKIYDAFFVVRNQINGWNPKQTEAALLYLRSGYDVSKLVFINDNGNEEFLKFP